MDDVKSDDFLQSARDKFDRAAEKGEHNRETWLDDTRFARLGEQWPETIKKIREKDNRPCLTINRMPSFIRQVVNGARQNRPAITVIPADSKADPDTAEIISGLIRNIEVSSNADVAYDTAVDNAVSGGFGYFRINTAYTSDDSFDQDIAFERIIDPLSVYEDPDAESVDGSDWNCCFIVKHLHKDEFEARYKGADKVDWDDYKALSAPWRDGDYVMIAEYWHREEVDGQIVALSDGTTVPMEGLEDRAEELTAQGIYPVGEPRTVKRKKVTQYIMTGAEVLETVEWPGRYIPIVPVYGEEVAVEGKRYFRSLIVDAKDTQRENNYWRSAGAENVALAPKIPFIGPVGAFNTDVEKWSTANVASHPYIEYDGPVPPQRQPFVGVPVGEMQQAAVAVDDMKAIIGLYDPSLGAQSNETSGVAIRQRQRQGDIGTFHFIDNLTRSIRHAGRILIDMIPKVYSSERMIRVLGQDMEPQSVQLAPGAPPQEQQAQGGPNFSRVYDIAAGKYDLVVKAGPSFGTQRELAQAEIVEVIRAYPDAAPVLGPMYLRNSDWPGAEEAADKLEQGGDQGPDQQQQAAVAQMQAQMQQMQQQAAQLAQENRELKAQYALKSRELDIKDKEADIKAAEVVARQQDRQNAAAVNMARETAQPSNPYMTEGLG